MEQTTNKVFRRLNNFLIDTSLERIMQYCVVAVSSVLSCTVICGFLTWQSILYYFGYELDVAMSKSSLSHCHFDTSDLHLPFYENNSWELLLENYERFRDPNKFVIFKTQDWQGLCNRFMNSISIFLLAIATNRTLWIEWNTFNVTYITSVERGGIMAYDDLFAPSRFLNRPPYLDEDYFSGGFFPHDHCVSKHARFGNLQKLDQYRVIHFNRYDFWGTHLMNNKRYKNSIFRGLNVTDGFPFLFRKLFSLKKPVKAKNCSWMIQYRTQWPPPFYTAPFDDFIKCANSSGLTPADYSSTYVISDNPKKIMDTSSPFTKSILKQMNLPRSRVTSRGRSGDLKTMQTMYELSECKNAVVSLGSSFGSCIAGLAHVQKLFRVGHDGSCIPVQHGLIDANCNAKNGCFSTYLANL